VSTRRRAAGPDTGTAPVLQGRTGKKTGEGGAGFNLGVAQIKAGDTATGTATLDALGQEPVDNDEQRALRDRANVALGFAALAAQQAPAARQYLERVTLHGPESNKALLAYGWAALDQPAPLSAPVPGAGDSPPGGGGVAFLRVPIYRTQRNVWAGKFGPDSRRQHARRLFRRQTILRRSAGVFGQRQRR